MPIQKILTDNIKQVLPNITKYSNNTINRTLTRDKNDKTILGNTTKTENSRRTIFIDKYVRNILEQVPKSK